MQGSDVRSPRIHADPLFPLTIDPHHWTIESFRDISYPNRNENADENVDEFNMYVRGPLRDRVLSLIGGEVDIPFKWCFTMVLPIFWAGLVLLFGCEVYADCEVARIEGGFSNLPQYLITNAAMNIAIAPIVVTLTYPLTLRATYMVATFVAGGVARFVVGSVFVFLAAYACQCLQAAEMAALAVVVTNYSPMWLASFIAGVFVTTLLIWWFFFKKTTFWHQRLLWAETI